jgi:hypothetical protein
MAARVPILTPLLLESFGGEGCAGLRSVRTAREKGFRCRRRPQPPRAPLGFCGRANSSERVNGNAPFPEAAQPLGKRQYSSPAAGSCERRGRRGGGAVCVSSTELRLGERGGLGSVCWPDRSGLGTAARAADWRRCAVTVSPPRNPQPRAQCFPVPVDVSWRACFPPRCESSRAVMLTSATRHCRIGSGA